MLETNTYRLYVRSGRRTIDEMLIDMAAVAARQRLGLLVIDEIQNLREAQGDRAAQLLNFLVQLDNDLGIPVILVGTPKAQPVLTGEFRRARRASGVGAFPWDRMQEDEEWNVFTTALWKYQYVRKPSPLTDELRHALYFEAQGITDVAVKLYMLAQIEAITAASCDEEEEVTKELIETVAQDRLRYLQRFLNALRRNKPDELKQYADIAPIDLTFAVSEAVKTLREKQGETAKEPPVEEEKKEGQPEQTSNTSAAEIEQRPVSNSASKRKKNTGEVKGVLVKVLIKGKIDAMDGYTSLKAGGCVRPGREFLSLKENKAELNEMKREISAAG